MTVFKVVRDKTVVPLHIMVCGNDPTAARELGSLVSRAGYDVCTVTGCAEDALRAAIEHGPDLVIADARDGTGDAVTAAVKIRGRFAIPCIVVTGNARTASRAAAARPMAVLANPVDAATVATALDKAADHLIAAE